MGNTVYILQDQTPNMQIQLLWNISNWYSLIFCPPIHLSAFQEGLGMRLPHNVCGDQSEGEM